MLNYNKHSHRNLKNSKMWRSFCGNNEKRRWFRKIKIVTQIIKNGSSFKVTISSRVPIMKMMMKMRLQLKKISRYKRWRQNSTKSWLTLTKITRLKMERIHKIMEINKCASSAITLHKTTNKILGISKAESPNTNSRQIPRSNKVSNNRATTTRRRNSNRKIKTRSNLAILQTSWPCKLSHRQRPMIITAVVLMRSKLLKSETWNATQRLCSGQKNPSLS